MTSLSSAQFGQRMRAALRSPHEAPTLHEGESAAGIAEVEVALDHLLDNGPEEAVVLLKTSLVLKKANVVLLNPRQQLAVSLCCFGGASYREMLKDRIGGNMSAPGEARGPLWMKKSCKPIWKSAPIADTSPACTSFWKKAVTAAAATKTPENTSMAKDRSAGESVSRFPLFLICIRGGLRRGRSAFPSNEAGRGPCRRRSSNPAHSGGECTFQN
jgi:hypothetical protein